MSKKPIIEIEPKTDNRIHDNPVLNRVYQNRGVITPAEIEYSLNNLIRPDGMKGMDKATEIILNHILAGSKIIIVGDYDCDGATATTIAVQGLTMLGAKNVSFMVPDRIKHGYGLSPDIVKLVGEQSPDLIITVDNGIASFAGCEEVKKLEKPCQIVVTDHHLAAEEGIPDADAIVNPNQPGCRFKSKNIAGCGVIFYVIMALRTKMREEGIFEKLGMTQPNMTPLLDVLALGTVADVVTLDYNNRILISQGLHMINSGMCRPGIKAVLELKNRHIGNIVSMDMGFSAGPCFNAAGRLDDMRLGIKCMLEEDEGRAMEYAQTLFDLNQKRKEIGSEMEADAIQILNEYKVDEKNFGVCLHEPTWHEGVVGILASRIKERLNRPVIIFTDTHAAAEARKNLNDAIACGAQASEIKDLETILGDNDIKGSARSVNGVHLKHVLDHINKTDPEILSKFGGHAMAAGVSLKYRHFEKFKIEFDKLVRNDLTEDMIKGRLDVDIKNIDPSLINLETAELLKTAGPWGQNFVQPSFSQVFAVETHRILGEKHLKMTLRPVGSDMVFDAIAFNCIENNTLPFTGNFEAVFSLDVNEWRGRKTLQLMMQCIQDLGPELNNSIEGGTPGALEVKGAAVMQKRNIGVVNKEQQIKVPF